MVAFSVFCWPQLHFFTCSNFFFVWVWGLNSGFTLAKQVLYHLNNTSISIFDLVILEMGSCKLFALAGLEP
jgi:hypothetical protein